MAKRIKLPSVSLQNKNDPGFTLMEVVIALTLFAVFAVVFISNQGVLVTESMLMKEEVMLRELCWMEMNKIIIDPPKFSESLTNEVETKKIENFPKYTSTIKYHKFKIPEISKITGEENNDDNDAAAKKLMVENVKKNMENLIWQVEVMVTNTETKNFLTLSGWLLNNEFRVNLSI